MIEKDSGKRLNFSPATREIIAKSAGYKCSIRRCLKNTICNADAGDKSKSIVDLGIASHIYAASPGGPRPAPIDMPDAMIMHESNGIWTCGSCGAIIDKVKLNSSDQMLNPEYSAENLFQMKKVRESAARMSVIDPEVNYLATCITPRELDEIFWRHMPELNQNSILCDIKAYVGKVLLNSSTPRMLAPGDDLKRKPIAAASQQVIKEIENPPVGFPYKAVIHTRINNEPDVVDQKEDRQRVIEIVGAWANTIDQNHRGRTLVPIDDVSVLITARDPKNMETCDSFMRAIGHGSGCIDLTSGNRENLDLRVWSYFQESNNFIWKLAVNFDAGVMRKNSTIRIAGKNLYDSRKNLDWEDGFYKYSQIMQKLVDGWQLIGFIGMNRNDRSIVDRMHPKAFEIDLKVSKSELDECLYRIEKIKFAIEIEKHWSGLRFLFTEIYFSRELLPEMIQAGSDEVLAMIKRGLPVHLNPEMSRYWRGLDSQKLLGAGEGRLAFKFVLRSNYISIERVHNRYRA